MEKVGHNQYTPGKCLNCGADVQRGTHGALYCGERCRQIAEFVRYSRRKLAEGTYERPDIAEAILIRRSQIVVGFYDRRARKVASKVRQELLSRSNGNCEKCARKFGTEGDARFTVQHISTEKGFKLEAWCYRCNMNDAQSVSLELTDEDIAFLIYLDYRVRAPKPELLCDDHENWVKIYHDLRYPKKKEASPKSERLKKHKTEPPAKPKGMRKPITELLDELDENEIEGVIADVHRKANYR